jgi:hypothetical protein
MLDWSYASIDERERDLLRQLSVFVGGFGLDEVRGVAGESDEVIEALEQLVLKSLVAVNTSGQSPRYRLLDTTRAYAGAKLRETGLPGEVSRRHARHYLEWLTRSTTCAAVPLEHASNVRAALEWALSDGGDPHIGVGLATYSCELFLRLGMVTESHRWSDAHWNHSRPNAQAHCRTWRCARRWGLTRRPAMPTRCVLRSNMRYAWRKGSTTPSISFDCSALFMYTTVARVRLTDCFRLPNARGDNCTLARRYGSDGRSEGDAGRRTPSQGQSC